MQQLNQAAMVRPRNPDGVIRLDKCVTGDIVKVDCGPAVFKLCERADGLPEMYVVVSGSIRIRESSQSAGRLQTMWFGTKVGYFRWKRGRLVHVYGVHYDMDERGDGHPVFHGQLGPAKEFASAIEDQFRLGGEVVDCVGPVLRNVRTPTAQMDFFSGMHAVVRGSPDGCQPGGQSPAGDRGVRRRPLGVRFPAGGCAPTELSECRGGAELLPVLALVRPVTKTRGCGSVVPGMRGGADGCMRTPR